MALNHIKVLFIFIKIQFLVFFTELDLNFNILSFIYIYKDSIFLVFLQNWILNINFVKHLYTICAVTMQNC